MATNMNDQNGSGGKKLDQALQGWADRSVADEESLTQLRGSILSELEDDSEQDIVEQTIVERATVANTNNWQTRVTWFALGVAAAALLLAFSSIWMFSQDDQQIVIPHPPEQDNLEMFAAITPEQLAQKTKLFTEMERIFGGQLDWVAESNGTIEIGVESNVTRTVSNENSVPIAIRITVVRKKPNEQDWTPAWTVDLVSRSERLVQFTSNNADAPELVVWTYTLPDGMIACDTELISVDGVDGLDAASSALQAAGVTKQVAAPESDGTEYQVFQSVVPLNNEVI